MLRRHSEKVMPVSEREPRRYDTVFKLDLAPGELIYREWTLASPRWPSHGSLACSCWVLLPVRGTPGTLKSLLKSLKSLKDKWSTSLVGSNFVLTEKPSS